MRRLIILIFPLCLISLLLLCSCNEKENEGTLLPKYDISCSVESDFSRIYVTENVDIYVDLTEPVSALPFRMDSLRYEKNDMGAYFESERDKFSGGETLFGGVSVNGIAVQPTISGNTVTLPLSEPVLSERLSINFGYTLLTPESETKYGRGDGSLKLFGCFPTLLPYRDNAFVTQDYSLFSSEYGYAESEYQIKWFTDNSVSIATNLPVVNATTRDNQTVIECAGKSYSPGAVVTERQTEIAENFITDNVDLIPYAKNAVIQYSAILDVAPTDINTEIKMVSVPLRSDFLTIGNVVMINEKLHGTVLIEAVYEGIAATYFFGAAATNDSTWISEGLPYFLSEYRLRAAGKDDEYAAALGSDRALITSTMEFLRGYDPQYVSFPAMPAEKFISLTEYNAMIRGGTAVAFDEILNAFGEKKFTKALRSLIPVVPMTTDEAIAKLSKSLGGSSEKTLKSYLQSGELFI